MTDTGRRLFVGNMPFNTTEDELISLFADYGSVETANIVLHKETGQPRGFGFVTMSTEEEAAKAKDALTGFGVGGRRLVVDDAKPKERR